MTTLDWVKLILKILMMIAEGLSASEAVACVAKEVHISEEEIWKHSGLKRQ